MLVTMTLIILSAATLVFFAEEFASAVKRLFAIPGVKLLLPLILVSYLLSGEPEVLSLLRALRDFFDLLSQGMASFLPEYSILRMACQVLALWLLTSLPVWIADAWTWRKTFKPFPYKGIFEAMLWLLWAILFVLPESYTS